jgi:hypothetical protein
MSRSGVFVYLILALLCTALKRMVSRRRGLRSKLLKKGIYKLSDPTLWSSLL